MRWGGGCLFHRNDSSIFFIATCRRHGTACRYMYGYILHITALTTYTARGRLCQMRLAALAQLFVCPRHYNKIYMCICWVLVQSSSSTLPLMRSLTVVLNCSFGCACKYGVFVLVMWCPVFTTRPVPQAIRLYLVKISGFLPQPLLPYSSRKSRTNRLVCIPETKTVGYVNTERAQTAAIIDAGCLPTDNSRNPGSATRSLC